MSKLNLKPKTALRKDKWEDNAVYVDPDSLDDSQWCALGSGAFKANTKTVKALPSGAYSISIDNRDGKPVFIKKDIKIDDLIWSIDSVADSVIKEIKTFWDSGDKFSKMGYLHRRGYLFYGPGGTGKTATLQQIVSGIVDMDGLVLYCSDPAVLEAGISKLREIEQDRKLVCVFEDIDAIIKEHGEDKILSILDGENQVNKVLNLATTNYPESLDKRLVSRPRRFDRVKKFDLPSYDTRKLYLQNKLPKSYDMNLWLKKTDGMSLASVAEAVISVLCLGNSLDDTIKLLNNMSSSNPSSSEFGGSVGFKPDEED